MAKAAAEAVLEEGHDESDDEEEPAPPAPAPAPAANPDDLLAGFFGEIAQVEEGMNADHKTEDKKAKLAAYDPGTAQAQIDRLMGKHHAWRNLDPFLVLELRDDLDADTDDIKSRYRKLSQLVHPDKCKLPNGRDAFEYVKNAHTTLMDESLRDTTKVCDDKIAVGFSSLLTSFDSQKLIERADKKVIKYRRKLIRKGMKEEDLPDGPDETAAVFRGE